MSNALARSALLESTIPAAPARLTLHKCASRTEVKPGATVDFEVTVGAKPGDDARDVRVCDRLPDGLRLVSAPGADQERRPRSSTPPELVFFGAQAGLGRSGARRSGLLPGRNQGGVARLPQEEGAPSGAANDIFAEWMRSRAPELSGDYVEKMDGPWEREIASRWLSELVLKEISADSSILVRSQDELVVEGLGAGMRREIWKLTRAVLRWGRRRHPAELTIEAAGLIELPRHERSRLAYPSDAVGLERIVEAVLNRPTIDRLFSLRDAAFVAAMGFSVATRPSEWRLSATSAGLHEGRQPSDAGHR